MRVSCDQCSASYELDLPPDAMARGRKLKFRCTACGHRFLVVREDGSFTDAAKDVDPAAVFGAYMEAPTVAVGAEATDSPPTIELQELVHAELPESEAAPEAAADGPCYLRQDGVIYEVEDYATLKRWIVERRVEATGELSMGDNRWVPLRDHADLLDLFDEDPGGASADAPPGLDDLGLGRDPTEEVFESEEDGDRPDPDRAWATQLTEEADPPSGPAGISWDEAPDAAGLAGLSPPAGAAAHWPDSDSEDDGPPPPMGFQDFGLDALPPDIEALLSGLSPGEPDEDEAAAPAGRFSSGAAPELAAALAALPPDIQALVAGLGEEVDSPTEEVPRTARAPAPSAAATGTPPAIEPDLFTSPSFGGATLEIPATATNDHLEWAGDPPRQANKSRSLAIFVALLVIGVGGWWWWQQQARGPVAAVNSSAVPGPAEAGNPASKPTAPGNAAPLPPPDAPVPPAAATAPAVPVVPVVPTPAAAPVAVAAAAAPAKPAAAPPPKEAKPAAARPTDAKPAAAPSRDTDVRALLGRGWSQVDKARYDDAQQSFGRAASVAPTSGGAHFGLGYVAEQQGDPGGAYREYCVAMAYSTGDAELRREIEARLRALGKSCGL